MARERLVPLCQGCEFRPIKKEAQKPVQGDMKITTRVAPDGGSDVAVIYSDADFTDNRAFRLANGYDAVDVCLAAMACKPIVEGAAVGNYNVWKGDSSRHCELAAMLIRDCTLGEEIFYKGERPVES